MRAFRELGMFVKSRDAAVQNRAGPRVVSIRSSCSAGLDLIRRLKSFAVGDH